MQQSIIVCCCPDMSYPFAPVKTKRAHELLTAEGHRVKSVENAIRTTVEKLCLKINKKHSQNMMVFRSRSSDAGDQRLQCVKKSSTYGFLKFFPKRLGIFNQFFAHLLYDHFYTRVQIFIRISPTLTKLCHTKRDHLAKFYISLEL